MADDHGIVRQGIRQLIENDDEIEIVGEADDGDQALKLVRDLRPDVLITDITMPGMSGLELIKLVKDQYPETHTLVLSTHNDEEYILESFEAGALGYLPKNAKVDDMVDAVYKISRGEIYYTQAVMNILGANLINRRSPGRSLKSWLTDREKEILKELVEGATNKEIANKLFISVRTVDTHRRNIMKKLNVTNGAQLVKVTMEKRLVE